MLLLYFIIDQASKRISDVKYLDKPDKNSQENEYLCIFFLSFQCIIRYRILINQYATRQIMFLNKMSYNLKNTGCKLKIIANF